MRDRPSLLKRLIGDRRGATAVEYALILAMIVLAMLGGLAALGGSTGGAWNDISNKVQAAH